MRFERYKQQFAFLEQNGISSKDELAAFKSAAETELAGSLKQRTLLNVKKKRRQPMYAALADLAVYAPARDLYLAGQEGLEDEYVRYREAGARLAKCPISPAELAAEKAHIYAEVAEINKTIQKLRQELALCGEVESKLPEIARTIERVEQRNIKKIREKNQESEVR